MGHIAWTVTRPGRKLMQPPHAHKPYREDVVFDSSTDADDVRRSLINHDGYPSDIIVRRQRAKVRS